ncbi:MAG: T9SS type A sorting domain-containing protein [Cytophagaceae bacterium]|nr:T9SS type A sorting domain-containing protein [Cytophagaceae bacterium]
MKKLLLSALAAAFVNFAPAQDANVSLSNLSSNCYYTGYNAGSGVISGINFEVLSDGNNSTNVFDHSFEVSLYLLACNNVGTATSNTPVVIKTYTVNNMQQLMAIDYTNQSVDLNQVSGLSDGTYRIGAWVNSDHNVPNPPDDPSDNTFLFTLNGNGQPAQSIINFTAGAQTGTLSSLQEAGFAIPNPVSSEQLSYIVSSNNFDSVELYDLLGQQHNIKGLDKGVYVLRITENKKFYSGRIVIQ